MVASVNHSRIRPGTLEDRLYQERIAEAAAKQNTLVVLPTGLGKTAIALRLMAEFLRDRPGKSILFLAPTRPLVVQHGHSVETTLFAPTPILLTGSIAPDKRAKLLRPPQIVVATPQVVANDLNSGTFPLEVFSLVVFDEAHRAVGDYPYVVIGARLQQLPETRILGMTASPGSQRRRIEEVWRNLSIEHFELRTGDDPDVQPYTHSIRVEPVSVLVPYDVHLLASLLRNALQHQTEELYRLGELPQGGGSLRDLLALGQILRRRTAQAKAVGGTVSPATWSAVTAQAVAMKLNHAVNLVESQGVEALRQFLRRQSRLRPTPATRAFQRSPEAKEVASRLGTLGVEHPKVAKVVSLVEEELTRVPQARIIVFAHYRQTAELLVNELRRKLGSLVRAERFVGQATHDQDAGLSQDAQVEILDRFRRGEVNCLVATSVAEEGLDIPTTDLVVLYEPVPDEIRTIQRRGRTGRTRAGRAVVLLAEGTRDVSMWHAARAKERRMHELLAQVEDEARRGPLPPPPRATVQRDLSSYAAE